MKCKNKLLKFPVDTPIGDMTVTYCNNGLHSISHNEDITDSNFDPQTGKAVTLNDGTLPIDRHTVICVDWLQAYFNDPKNINNVFQPQICHEMMSINGSFTQRTCLTLLQNVHFGQIVSYKDLADMMKNPGAVRAIGGAMSHNPLQLLIPCHRVIPSPNKYGVSKVGNYAGGHKNRVKKWLLQHEGHVIDEDRLQD